MKTIHAIYENGVFRPTEHVELPNGIEVEVHAPDSPAEQKLASAPMEASLAKVYDILGHRYSSGFTDTAERHNEHQP